MFNGLRRHASTILIAMVVAAVTAGGPAFADGVRHAFFAHNSDKVDDKDAVGYGATIDARAGKLVATNSNGVLPNNILTKARDANLLDGLNSTAFAAAEHNHDGSYAPPLAVQEVLTQVTVPVSSSNLYTVNCPPGKVVVSGGVNMNDPATLRASHPADADTWQFRIANPGPGTPLTNLHAMCVAQ